MTVQETIDLMHSGDRLTIAREINSESPILAVNAMLAGMRHGMANDAAFVRGLLKWSGDCTRLMNISVGAVAEAALHLGGAKVYTGDDEETLQLMQSNLAGFAGLREG